MTRKVWRQVAWPIVFAGLAGPFVTNCGGALPSVPGAGALGDLGPGKCPDMAKIEEIDAFDFGKEFSLKADVAAKIKAGVGAAASLKALSDKLEADLSAACGTLAKDLGDTGTYKDAQEACKAASKVIGDAKAKLGASAKIGIDMTEPSCGVDIKAYGDCAGHCDASIKPGEVDVKCEPGKLQGTCSGQCSGSCDLSAAAACSGECDGTCDADVKGSCSGKCNGKCDGKASTAECAGSCEGKCSGNVKATCKGKCGGSCKLTAKASCQGTCSGSCDVKMEAPKCTGKMEPPQMSAECKAKCDVGLQAKAVCTPPHVAFRITGAADAKFAASLQGTMEKDLPALFAVAKGMAEHAGQLVDSAKTVITGVQGAVQGAGSPMAIAKLTACVGAPFTGALDAVGKVQANVSVSVSVSASASASGSAGGGGHAE